MYRQRSLCTPQRLYGMGFVAIVSAMIGLIYYSYMFLIMVPEIKDVRSGNYASLAGRVS